MSTKVGREEVYRVVDGERAFQDAHWQHGASPEEPVLSIGEELLLLEEYLHRAREEWTAEAATEYRTLHMIRKIAAIAVRCMEHHGAPQRNTSDVPHKNPPLASGAE